MEGGRPTFCSIGRSLEGREQVVAANFDLAAPRSDLAPTLLIGGIHGDEPATVILLERFVAQESGGIESPVAVLALCNPDGYERATRYNARGVDLNRNCGYRWSARSEEPSGPAPWSEPEICALRDFIVEWRPSKIVSLHWALAEIDADGVQSTACAEAMWAAMDERERGPYRLRVTSEPLSEPECPGSLGQWCAYGLATGGRRAPVMITLELPYEPELNYRPEILPADHLEVLQERWRRDQEGYLRGVQGGVFKMLRAACLFNAKAGI